MSSFETYRCIECGEEFAAHPSANAAGSYCSPHCESEGKGLA